MEAIKSCPFCGAAAELHEIRNRINGYGIREEGTSYFVRCTICYAQSSFGVTGRRVTGVEVSPTAARRIAIEKWNRRPLPEGRAYATNV